MFKDYYDILEIKQSASQPEIKIAFKKQAIKWHPDRNKDFDSTEKMQEINEAYLILKDNEAKSRYDIEYFKFKKFTNTKQTNNNSNQSTNQNTKDKEYHFEDDILRKWMQNAKNQAVELAKQTIKEMAELSIIATKEAGSKMIETFVYYAISGLIIMLLFKACN
jgi:DnaJ-class molecular chaperone